MGAPEQLGRTSIAERLPARTARRSRCKPLTTGTTGINHCSVAEGVAGRPVIKTKALNPFRTAVSFWGQLGTNYLEFEWFVPKTGMEF